MAKKIPENLADLKLEELKKLASETDIEGRSDMNKEELIGALQAHRANQLEPEQQEEGVSPTAQYVPRNEYDRVVEENKQLRAQIQYRLQGAVGATNPNSPDPGVPGS